MTTEFDTLDCLAGDETAVKDVLTQIVAAWDANDADAFAELYTDDATVVTAGTYSQGRDAIREFAAAGFSGPLKGTKSLEKPQHIRFVAPDVAIVHSFGGFLPPGQQTVQPSLERRATWVLSRADTGWLVESYHNCAANRD